MDEKLTPARKTITRSRVPVYSANSHCPTQKPRDILMPPASPGVRAQSRSGRARKHGRRGQPSNAPGAVHSLSISRAIRESSKNSRRDEQCRRRGRAPVLDAMNVDLRFAPTARVAAVQRRQVFEGRNRVAAAVANSTCCSLIMTGVRGDAVVTRCSMNPGASPKFSSNSAISVPPVSRPDRVWGPDGAIGETYVR